jgi:S1-C subfamily serine protease
MGAEIPTCLGVSVWIPEREVGSTIHGKANKRHRDELATTRPESKKRDPFPLLYCRQPMKPLVIVLFSAFSAVVAAQSNAPSADSQKIFERTKAATVIVLAGEGAGRLSSIATGVVVSQDGVILTAWHAIKGALEVQVRIADGDVFDRVELLGVDERRDVAALKISAGALHALVPGSATNIVQGDPVYAVTNADGLSWSATEGIISGVRPADEVPGLGAGFRVLQFTAPVAHGASGGALVDHTGAVIGIIVGGKGTAAFAIPIDSVLSLSDLGPRRLLGSGANLQMPAQSAALMPQSSNAISGSDSKQILQNAKTVYVSSKTAFLTVDTVVRALTQEKGWDKLGLTIVTDQRVADLFITFDRPLFTYYHTFVITDKRTSIVLGSGKVTAFDGTIASGPLANDIVKIFAAVRYPELPKK